MNFSGERWIDNGSIKIWTIINRDNETPIEARRCS